MKDARVLYFQQKLATERAWVERAILALYERQTSHEQASRTTHEKNGRGFSQAHADFMTSLAKQLLNPGHHLSPKQLSAARKILVHYVRQLVAIADEKAQKVQQPVAEPEEITVQSTDGWTITTDRNAKWFTLGRGVWEIDFHGERAVLKKMGKEMIAQPCSSVEAAQDLVQLFKSFVMASEIALA